MTPTSAARSRGEREGLARGHSAACAGAGLSVEVRAIGAVAGRLSCRSWGYLVCSGSLRPSREAQEGSVGRLGGHAAAATAPPHASLPWALLPPSPQHHHPHGARAAARRSRVQGLRRVCLCHPCLGAVHRRPRVRRHAAGASGALRPGVDRGWLRVDHGPPGDQGRPCSTLSLVGHVVRAGPGALV
jgi:hypothetical protein